MIGVAIAGAILLAVASWAAAAPAVPRWEVRAFAVVNGLPHALLPVLWLPMQVGNLVVGAALGLVVAAWERDLALAAAVVAAVVAKLVAERWLRARLLPRLEVRLRPGSSQAVVAIRGSDVPTQGVSFPSGHTILAAALAALLFDPLGTWLGWGLVAVAALAGVGRVFVGAHNPADVLAGWGAGMVIGGLLGMVVS
jgi:membrane-associated phospholipid phosphatase